MKTHTILIKTLKASFTWWQVHVHGLCLWPPQEGIFCPILIFLPLPLSLSLSLFWVVKDGIFLNNRDKRINSFLQLSEAGLVIWGLVSLSTFGSCWVALLLLSTFVLARIPLIGPHSNLHHHFLYSFHLNLQISTLWERERERERELSIS